MKYIPVDKLITIIKERKAQQDQWINRYHDPINQGISHELTEILSIIESIQQEQPEVNLEKETKRWWEEHLHLNPENQLWMDAHQSVSLARYFYELGQHIKYQQDRAEFAKLKAKEWQEGYDEGYAKGLNARNEEISLPSNLDEAAEEQWAAMEYASNTARESTSVRDWCTDDIVNAFKAGAKWMAGQGESHETEIVSRVTGNGLLPAVTCLVNKSYKEGDKVVVQIRKK